MADIGDSIEELIKTNIKLWHKATKIKKNGKPDHSLPTKERVDTFYEIRELNAQRSADRWTIDKKLGKSGANETKSGYYRGK